MIWEIQKRWAELSDKRIKTISDEFLLSKPAAKKYIYMTEDEINSLDAPASCKKRKTIMDDYLNVIYKMLRDKRKPEIIMAYIIKKGYSGSLKSLENYISILAKNNFNIRFYQNGVYDFSYPDYVTAIRRNELLRYITTKNTKTKKSETVAQYFETIKEKYPIVDVLKDTYDEFYDVLTGSVPDRLDSFIGKYRDSVVNGFIVGLLNDITPVKNAISYTESNGFVEGNNNKFKLIKRILYGRANLDTLFKKSYLAFKANLTDFDLSRLLKKDASH
jgi:hypothetical protein